MASTTLTQKGKSHWAEDRFSKVVLSFSGLSKWFAAIASAVFLTGLPQAVAQAKTTLSGCGATFPYPMYARWFAEYHKLHPDIEIEYNPVGSGAGIREITAGVFDFGASDGPMDDHQLKDYRSKRDIEVLHFPTVLGADVAVYNIPGATADLKFTPESLAGIFLGKITKWNDPELTKTNPDAKLPNHEIVVTFRSDGSGTTCIWTDYLAKVSEDWDKEIGFGTSVPWPVGVGARATEALLPSLSKPHIRLVTLSLLTRCIASCPTDR